MELRVKFTCLTGSAKFTSNRDPANDGKVLYTGQSVTASVLSAPDVPTEKGAFQEWAKDNWQHAWNSAGIGKDGWNNGRVQVTALDCDLVVRQYLEVNAFLEPDAADYEDYIVKQGSSVHADTIGGNVVTLIPMRPLV